MQQHDRWEGAISKKISDISIPHNCVFRETTAANIARLAAIDGDTGAVFSNGDKEDCEEEERTRSYPHSPTPDHDRPPTITEVLLIRFVESGHFCGHVDMLSMPGWNVIGPRGYLFSKSIRTITIHQTPNIWNISFQTASVLSQKMNGGPVHC